MTSRTPPLYDRGNETNLNKTEPSNTIDYNTTSNQSTVGGNNTNTSTMENRPMNRGQRRPVDNYSSLFGVEYYHIPCSKKPDTKKEELNVNANEPEKEYNSENIRTDSESDMADSMHGLKDLEERYRLHSSLIHGLERDLRKVQLENDEIKGQMTGRREGGSFENRGRDVYKNGFKESDTPYKRYPEIYRDAHPTYRDERDIGEKRRSPAVPPAPGGSRDAAGAPDILPYWGINKFYHPQYATSYRRDHIAFNQNNAQSEQQSGLLYIIRYNESASDEVKVAFRQLQTIIKSFGGYVLGIAGKNKIFVIEGESGWKYCRNQSQRQQVAINYRHVDDAIAILWFPTRQTAHDFFHNSFRNRFKQNNFPSPEGFECHIIPLLTLPSVKLLDTYLFIEVMHAKKFPTEHLQSFEAEARYDILRIMPHSLPFVASDMEGHKALKHGLLFSEKCKIFVSTFNSMSEISEIWEAGVIQRMLMKWNISGPVNIFACSLHDWNDYS